jgi:hypothetical protein
VPDLPYSGYASRAAHFASRPPPPGLAADHTTGATEPDIFNPQPDTPTQQDGTVWSDGAQEATNQEAMLNLAAVPVSHWYDGQPAVPSGETYGRAQQAMQERMMVDHWDHNYVPDGIRLYQHATEGQVNEFTVGRPPFVAGETIPDGSQYLANGRNGYDQINQPNEVYAGDVANVGRYRLGVKTNMHGLYEYPLGKFGQDALLHAYTGITPTFPAVKNQMDKGAAPYTPNSSGASAYWGPAVPFQIPSMFALPSETSVTDYGTSVAAGFEESGDFENGERL